MVTLPQQHNKSFHFCQNVNIQLSSVQYLFMGVVSLPIFFNFLFFYLIFSFLFINF